MLMYINWKTKLGFHGSDVSRRCCCNGPRDGGGGGGVSSGGGTSGGGFNGGGGGGNSGIGTKSCSGVIIYLIIPLLTL